LPAPLSWNQHQPIALCTPLFTRQCEFEGDLLTKDIPYDNGRDAYAYSINKEPPNVLVPVSYHLGFFTIEPVQGGKSLLVWRQY